MNKATLWLISVRTRESRRDFEFPSYSQEEPLDTYRRIKQNAQKILDKYPPNSVTVDIISKTMAFKPKGEKPHRSRYWCPYCNKWRVFFFDDDVGVNKCNICGISDSDFYVRKYNDLWKREMAGLRRVKK